MDDISHVEEAMKRLHSHKGVRGTVVVNADGIPIRCSIVSLKTGLSVMI